MKSSKRFLVLSTAFASLVACTGFGQTVLVSPAVPGLLPYASIAHNPEGKPLSGTFDVSFSIYKSQQGGDPLWKETQTVSFDTAGYFKVRLGAASAQGIPTQMFTSADARWLQVQVAGQSQSPRILMASVPYALKAADASTLGGLPASAFLRADASGPTGSASVAAQPATATGAVSRAALSAPSSDFTVSGSPVTNAGTFGLLWGVAPTSQETANAIVKRDQKGNFAAEEIVANQGLLVNATQALSAITGIDNGSGIGVYGGSTQLTGVLGLSHLGYGVEGTTTSTTGSGVAGVNNGGGVGVMGNGDVGVSGTGQPYGFVTDSNVMQTFQYEGWVKGMAFVNAEQAPYSITRCWNSTLTGVAETTPPCGFDLEEIAPGQFLLSDSLGLVIHSFPLVTFGRRFKASRVQAYRGPESLALEIQTTGPKISVFNDPDYEGAEYSVILF